MGNNLNIELRKEILEIALNIEDEISKLMILFLNIEKEKRKAISNNNSNLSFKNKIDLLYDLNILSEDEYKKMLLLMEFRNQFLHNVQCNSFEKAICFLGKDRSKRLLSYNDTNDIQDTEFNYINAYRSLFIICLEVIETKLKIKESQIEDKRNMITDLAEYAELVIDEDTKIMTDILNHSSINSSDSKELSEYKISIHRLIENGIDNINNLDEIKYYRDKITKDISLTIKNFFK